MPIANVRWLIQPSLRSRRRQCLALDLSNADHAVGAHTIETLRDRIVGSLSK